MGELYKISTRKDLVKFLGIPEKLLTYVLYVKKVDSFYTTFEIPKKNGGVRKISAPSEQLKQIQKILANKLYEHREKKRTTNISHGFEKGRCIKTNAKIHRNKRYVLNIDIENFFESIHFGRVRGFFNKNKSFALPIEVATVIAQIACYNGKLPQGAPTSPIISNLICEILDYRLFKIAKKYRLNYTRYADDLTFSTNDKKFLESQTTFYEEVSKEIEQAGFKINKQKVRMQYKDSRQVVTGLVVNEKINVPSTYYKETRAMAHHLYKYGRFEINGEEATPNQLEGRFSFLNHLTCYNNNLDNEKHGYKFNNLNSREREYQKFLFYKLFFAHPKPLIVTEGKTDIVYLKAALKKLYKEYPQLVSKNDDGSFDYKISFLKRAEKKKNTNKKKTINKLEYFLGIVHDGADTVKNLYNFFHSEKKEREDVSPNYFEYFKKTCNHKPYNPIIFLFDNEIQSRKRKPISKFISHVKLDNKKKEKLKSENMVKLEADNLYILTNPLVKGMSECEIEDLFDDGTLNHKINGKSFTKEDKYDKQKFYGKEIFSKYILKNYINIDFDGFRPLLDNLVKIIEEYKEECPIEELQQSLIQ